MTTSIDDSKDTNIIGKKNKLKEKTGLLRQEEEKKGTGKKSIINQLYY